MTEAFTTAVFVIGWVLIVGGGGFAISVTGGVLWSYVDIRRGAWGERNKTTPWNVLSARKIAIHMAWSITAALLGVTMLSQIGIWIIGEQP